jgi:hypothetical protein
MGTTTLTVSAPATQPVESFSPTTFLERGVIVPFTTPQLNGARARPGERRSLELIIPNPSGGRGVYIVALGHIHDFCALTLNDRRLTDAISNLRGVTPETIRLVARDVADTGLAGQAAAAAAERAREGDNIAKLQANFDLLINLVRQTEALHEVAIPPEQASLQDLEHRGRRAVHRIAGRLRRTPEDVAAALEQLAEIFKGVGVRHNARIPRELETLTNVRQDVAKYSQTAIEPAASQARVVSTSADLTIKLVTATLTDARALASDVRALVVNWTRVPDATLELLARPDWLLDGWNRICALWTSASDPGDAIGEMAALVPTIPREADAWSSYRVDPLIDLPQFRRTVVRQLEDWRTGVTVADLIARNESLFEQSL